MIIAKQSTARTVTVGPVLDADGVAVTDCVVGDFKISKNGGAPAALNGSATLTHRNTGHYSLALTASDLDTVGQAEVVIDDTVNGCPMKEITVVEEAVYDAFYAAAAPGYVAKAHGIVDEGTAQSVGANQIVLRSAAAFVDDALIGCTVLITSGSQAGSRSIITDYVGSTDTATLGNGWTGATPTGTPDYIVFGSAAGASVVDANVVQVSGDAAAAEALESYLDGSEFMPVDAHKQEWSISGSTLTAKKPDDTTTAYTKTLTTTPGADPITGST
jgi:hypothetical protein